MKYRYACVVFTIIILLATILHEDCTHYSLYYCLCTDLLIGRKCLESDNYVIVVIDCIISRKTNYGMAFLGYSIYHHVIDKSTISRL